MNLPRLAKIAAAALGSAALALTATAAPARAAHPARPAAMLPPLTIGLTGVGLPFVQHFNPFLGYSAQPGAVTYAIYEPLYIVDNINYKEYPWLATAYKWSKDGHTLTFTIRHGVRWSDGVPFTARDVYYTLDVLSKRLTAQNPNGDIDGLWGKGSPNAAQSVTMPAPDQVAITFKTVNLTRFGNWNGVANNTDILPEHIWSKVKDPFTFQNPNPVGTGPFTQVKNFSSQGFDLGRNPYYWQLGKPAFDTLRIVGFTSAPAMDLALEGGQLDWEGDIIPGVEKAYDARNPRYYHHWYYAGYAAIPLFLNVTKYPFSLPAFRQALSMAVNRPALNYGANYGYAPPADITGLPAALIPKWRDPSIPNALAQYNPAASKALLVKNGFTYRSGALFGPKGHRVSMEILPTFTQADAPILQRNFQDIGIDTSTKLLQFAGFNDRINKGQFDLADYWGFGSGSSPYQVYEGYFHSTYLTPVGQQPAAGQDFGRWSNPELDAIFNRFPTVTDPAQQRALAYRMERIFVDNLPAIPTVVPPTASNFSTLNYTGYPTQQDNYAYSPPFSFATDTILMLTRIHPSH